MYFGTNAYLKELAAGCGDLATDVNEASRTVEMYVEKGVVYDRATIKKLVTEECFLRGIGHSQATTNPHKIATFDDGEITKVLRLRNDEAYNVILIHGLPVIVDIIGTPSQLPTWGDVVTRGSYGEQFFEKPVGYLMVAPDKGRYDDFNKNGLNRRRIHRGLLDKKVQRNFGTVISWFKSQGALIEEPSE